MRFVAWTTAVVLGAIVVVRLLGELGLDDTWVTVPLLGAFPWVVATAAVVTTLVGIARMGGAQGVGRAGALLVLVTLAGVAIVVPRTVRAPQPDADGPLVTVAVVNARIGGADPTEIVTAVREQGVDLLAVVEGTVAFDDALRAAGIDALLTAADVGPAGAVHAVGNVVPQRDGFPRGDTPDVVWDHPAGERLLVTTLHAAAPIGDEGTRVWAEGVARTPPPDGPTTLVLGDFNATIDHATFRALLAQGWRDAAAEAGRGLAPTYDGLVDDSPALPMAIDHVLVPPHVAVVDVRTRDVAGTDHRMVIADLRLP